METGHSEESAGLSPSFLSVGTGRAEPRPYLCRCPERSSSPDGRQVIDAGIISALALAQKKKTAMQYQKPEHKSQSKVNLTGIPPQMKLDFKSHSGLSLFNQALGLGETFGYMVIFAC